MDLCCICLDPPKQEDPLLLLSCGCNTFFHKDCETKWTDTIPINTPIKCPVCKREPIMKVNYCFSYDAGPSQKFLFSTAIIFSLEVPLGIYYNTWIIGAQGLYIILYPFVAPFPYDITYFLLQYIATMIVNLIILLMYNTQTTASDIIIYRSLHIAVMFFFINNKLSIPPLTPFVISREITHSKIAWPQPQQQ